MSVLDDPTACRWCSIQSGPKDGKIEEGGRSRRDWRCSNCGHQNTTIQKPGAKPPKPWRG